MPIHIGCFMVVLKNLLVPSDPQKGVNRNIMGITQPWGEQELTNI